MEFKDKPADSPSLQCGALGSRARTVWTVQDEKSFVHSCLAVRIVEQACFRLELRCAIRSIGNTLHWVKLLVSQDLLAGRNVHTQLLEADSGLLKL